jgi:hypothetical protein
MRVTWVWVGDTTVAECGARPAAYLAGPSLHPITSHTQEGARHGQD